MVLLNAVPLIYKLLLVVLVSLTSSIIPHRQSEPTSSGYGLYVFATANHPAVTNGSSSGGNPIIFWRWIEPEEGVYNWAILDRAVVQAVMSGTRIVPRIVTNYSIFAQPTPEWFFDSPNAQFYYPHDEAAELGYRAPVPWDPVYQEKFGNFLEALGERYNDNPAIEFFQIASTGVYGEMYLGSNHPNGYSVETYKASIQHWTEAWRDAFPDTNLSIMINGLGDNIGREAAEYAVSRGYYLQMNNPDGTRSTRELLAKYSPATKIIIEAENNGCSTATGASFETMIEQLFSFDYHVDYVTLCPASFTSASTAGPLEQAWERLPR